MGIIKPTESIDKAAAKELLVLELNASPSINHCKANVVTVNLMVLKNHVLKQDALAFGYITTTIDLVMQLIVHTNGGLPQIRPTELDKVYKSAQSWVKKQDGKRVRNAKSFTRTYVRLWTQLVCYIAKRFDYYMAEFIMVEAYNHMATRKSI